MSNCTYLYNKNYSVTIKKKDYESFEKFDDDGIFISSHICS